ncbi:MAG: hypothetical protein O3A85_03735 [Proteobacteria bacterium]|nr:hypothetical protein [Pseudomonadota bacterium]
MADELLVYENYAYLSDEDRQRPGIFEGAPGKKFVYEGFPPLD